MKKVKQNENEKINTNGENFRKSGPGRVAGVRTCPAGEFRVNFPKKKKNVTKKMEKKKGLDIMKVRRAKIEQKWVGGEGWGVHELAKNEQK